MEIISKNYSHFTEREQSGGLDILFGRIFNVQLVINTEFVNFIAQSLSYTKSFLYQNMFFAYNWFDTVEPIRSGSLFHLVVNLSPFQSYRLLR